MKKNCSCSIPCIALGTFLLLHSWVMAVPQETGHIRIDYDFVAEFGAAQIDNSSSTSAASREAIKDRTQPAIFLHPKGSGDAVLTYPNVVIPEANENALPFLIFSIGMREGIEWNSSTANPNGVRFSIAINEQNIFTENLAQTIWQDHALSLEAWAGKSVSISFRTNAIEGNTAYDWALFGSPLLVSLNPVKDAAALPKVCTGAVWLQLESAKDTTLTFTWQEKEYEQPLAQGMHWLPLYFENRTPHVFEIANTDVTVKQTLWGRFPAKLAIENFALSSPLVLAERPFDVLLSVKNTGRGMLEDPVQFALTDLLSNEDAPSLLTAQAPQTLKDLAPGDTTLLRWQNLVAPKMMDCRLSLEVTPADGLLFPLLPFHVFPKEPTAWPDETASKEGVRYYAVQTNVQGNIQMRVAEDDSRRAYVHALVKQGEQWQTVGSLYPLAAATFLRASGERVEDTLHVETGKLTGDFAETEGRIGGQIVRGWYTFDPTAPRLKLHFELEAIEDIQLLSFQAPSFLAGDRAYGTQKDFAIFSGLEYLEKEEPSSSDRDLAYPLNERSVPAIHKIAAPIIAVQGADTLAALLWNPHQEWSTGNSYPAAYFNAPAPETGHTAIAMSLFAPSVGTYVQENTREAQHPFLLKKGEIISLEAWLVLDSATRYGTDSIVHGPHKGGLALQAYQHYFDVFGLPQPSLQPRSWQEEQALCLRGYTEAVWNEDPPGWSHCYSWKPDLLVGHATPMTLLQESVTNLEDKEKAAQTLQQVLTRAVEEKGPEMLWSNAGCHILMGELPFYYGYTAEAMQGMLEMAQKRLEQREKGMWVWRPQSEKYATLGTAGDHTLGQAAFGALLALRTARLTGDRQLMTEALDAMQQMLQYEVPRGAQTWECPLYQPDILASAYAVRAYCEAYRMTENQEYLAHARYWAWTGLPFLYLWHMDDYPTMQYNVIAVMGSTFFNHSWIGLPVVWCGLVYAYALQDLAEFDDSFAWKTIAQGITNSAMWQQYSEGSHAGTYPDSWNMIKNTANPADINPENILINEFRLRGVNPEIQYLRIVEEEGPVALNTNASISCSEGCPESGHFSFRLSGIPGRSAHALLAPVKKPKHVDGAGMQVENGGALISETQGWYYNDSLQALVFKTLLPHEARTISVQW